MALGADRKKDNDAMDAFGFLGVFGTEAVGGIAGIAGFVGFANTAGNGSSAKIEGIRLSKLIGGGAAESKDEARVRAGLLSGMSWTLSSPSRKIAGPMLWLHQGRASKSMVDGKDSKSASSS